MMIVARQSWIKATFAAILVSISISGCGDTTGLAKRYPVSGKVSLNGQPLEKGRISFIPVAPDGMPAAGQIEAGQYRLTTLAPDDGAIPGKYKVTILSQEIDTSEMKAVAKGGQFHHDKTYLKALKNAKSLVPSRYAIPDTSGLEREVVTQSNRFDLDLTD